MTDTTPATARAMPRARRPKGVPGSTPGMRAAIYVRLSRETEESTSPERQRAACEALCTARGWQVIAVEEDIDVSGYSRGLDREDGKPILRTDGLPLVTRPPILDMDTWHALQDELKRRKGAGEQRRERTSLLRAVLYCGLCHSRMYTFTAKGKVRYRCIGRLKQRQRTGQQGTCYGPNVAAEHTEAHVTELFLEQFGKLPVVRMVERVGEDFRPQIRQAEEALSDLEKDRYERGLFKGEDGARRYADQYAKLEDRLASLKERQGNAKPAGVEAVPTGKTFGELWKDANTEGKRDLLLEAGAYVEVAPARGGGPRMDTSRLSVFFGDEGKLRRAKADGKDTAPVIDTMAEEVDGTLF
ncbi:recombinase family protein [Streptomyces sp. HC307]|uniref:recombinase family protein n=1 Tax=Streptomyces flavusporus TaxID=3385496 RepID=UPI0039172F64